MGAGSGVALKALQWFLRGVEFCSAGLVLAIYSYFLATLHNHGLDVGTWIRAVEGISGAAALYAGIGLLLLCCLAGLPLTSFLAIVLDIAFAAAFIYVASANRGGAGSCSGTVDTPFGTGDADSNVPDGSGSGGFTNLPSFREACKMETACFAVSIVAIVFFLLSALNEFALARHHQREKRYGPGPRNDYTSGYGRRGLLGGLFSRRSRRRGTDVANPNMLPKHTHPDQVRDSYATTEGAADGVPTQPYHPLEARGRTGGLVQDGARPEDTTAPAHYPPANYRYDDGVYPARQV